MKDFLKIFISIIYVILALNFIVGTFIAILMSIIGFIRDIIINYNFSEFTLNLIKNSVIFGIIIFNISILFIIIKILIINKK